MGPPKPGLRKKPGSSIPASSHRLQKNGLRAEASKIATRRIRMVEPPSSLSKQRAGIGAGGVIPTPGPFHGIIGINQLLGGTFPYHVGEEMMKDRVAQGKRAGRPTLLQPLGHSPARTKIETGQGESKLTGGSRGL